MMFKQTLAGFLLTTFPQHSHLTRWFAEVMRSHHEAQISFREKCKAQIQRQLEIGELTGVLLGAAQYGLVLLSGLNRLIL